VSTDPAGQESPSTAPPPGTPGQPTEEELRAAYEEELRRITPAEVMLQSAVSLLNIGARRLGLTGDAGRSAAAGASATGSAPAGAERDLEQVRDAIDGVRALLGILERSVPQELRPLRDALSQLQIAYAREAPASGDAEPPSEQAPPDPGRSAPPDGDEAPAPGPAQSSGRLWVPGS
jgi:hypothetical protein